MLKLETELFYYCKKF